MKVSEALIQNRNIDVNTSSDFIATYKGHTIYISSKHGLGKPIFKHLTRFNIDVKDKEGLYAVQAYEDCHDIKDAIRYALKGACLIS